MITNLNDFRKQMNENHMDFQEPNNIDKIVQLLKTHSMNELEEMGYSKGDISIANGISMKQNNISFKDEDDERIGDDPSSKQYYGRTLNNKNDKVILQNALDNLIKKDDQYFIDMYIRGYNLHSGGASEPDNDPEFLDRMVDESRSDIQFALDEFEEFYEEMIATQKFDIIVNDDDKLMSACAAHANGNPILDFVYLERKINERTTTASLPNVTTTEELAAHISSGIQKAMDIFTSQQKMPKMTVSIKNEYMHGLSQTFEEDELGIFKKGVKHAQIQIFNSSRLSLNEDALFNTTMWGTFSLKYEVLSGGSNGVPYMYANDDNQFMYDIIANKFFTRNDYFATIPEKRVTGYNTKRVK